MMTVESVIREAVSRLRAEVPGVTLTMTEEQTGLGRMTRCAFHTSSGRGVHFLLTDWQAHGEPESISRLLASRMEEVRQALALPLAGDCHHDALYGCGYGKPCDAPYTYERACVHSGCPAHRCLEEHG